MRNIQPESLIGKEIVCAETGKRFIGEAQGCTVNYARNDAGEIFSDEGVDIREKKGLLDRTKPFFGYISSDGKLFTGWKGNELGRVVQSWSIQLTRRSNWHDAKSYRFFKVLDIHGGLWSGRGSAGMCINLRAVKA